MVAESINFNKEYYFAILMDRSSNGPVMVASPKGGMDIEQVAAETPELIYKQPIDINQGITKAQSRFIAEKLGFADVAQVYSAVFSDLEGSNSN